MQGKNLPAHILLSASELRPNAQILPADPNKNQLGVLAIISDHSPTQYNLVSVTLF
jgi:hypothetical protein